MSGHPRKTIGPEGGSDMLRVALEAARRDGPDRAQLARLAARLPLHLPGGPGGGEDPGGPAEGGATGGAGTATGGAGASATGGGAGTATGGGAGAEATGGGAGAPATRAPTGIASTGAVAPPSVLSGLGIGAALGVVLVGAVWLMPSRSQPPPLAPPGAAEIATATPAEAAAAPAAATPEAAAEASLAGEPPRAPAPEPPRAPAGAPWPARASASTAGATAAGGSAPAALPDAETEIGLLQRAQEALAARPAEALALADAHLARFPGGALAQEREVIAVGALEALGRDEAALARARRFVAAHPSSAYRRRLEILVPELRHARP
ncbi:hypothetical protein WMF18_28800 [Sorangium sp. So ce315]|uniref:hypothetical protein n=1 Tax=Sorangium sp. So ce315 TaxID=3133299 RepID=UPI003F641EC3